MTTKESESRHIASAEGLAYNTLRQLIHWDPVMVLGDPEIDGEHEKLFELAEKACKLSRDHENAPEIVRAFTEFGERLIQHFALEERKYLNTGSEGETLHIAQHNAMKSEFEFIRQRLSQGGIGWAYEEQALVVLNFMIGATVGHVLQTDAHLAQQLN